MRAKRENKNDAEIAREFNVSRFLWTFATDYMKAKKEGKLEKFWEGSASDLTSFDEENPGCRRDSSILGDRGKLVASEAPLTPRPSRLPPVAAQTSRPDSSTLRPISATVEKPLVASTSPSPSRQSNIKSSAMLVEASATTRKSNPVSVLPPRTRSISPIAGPSQSRQRSSSADS